MRAPTKPRRGKTTPPTPPDAQDSPAKQPEPAPPEYRAISVDEINAIAQQLADVPTKTGLPVIRILDAVATRRIELKT